MEKEILISVFRTLLSDVSLVVNISPLSQTLVDLYFSRLFTAKGEVDTSSILNPNTELGRSYFMGYINAYISIDVVSLCDEYGYEFVFTNNTALAVHKSQTGNNQNL